MAKNKKSKKNKTDAKRIQQELQESAHKIWLAGLGALSAAGETGSRVFQQLIDKGEGVEKEGREKVDHKVDETRNRVDASMKDARKRVETVVDDALKGVDERLTEVLHKFGVPTREEIHSLTRRVEELNKKVDQLRDAPAPAAPKKTAAAAKAATNGSGDRKVYHVTTHDEGWKVEAEGAARATSVHGTKNEAVTSAKELAQGQRPSAVVIHKMDGTIQDQVSYDVEAN